MGTASSKKPVGGQAMGGPAMPVMNIPPVPPYNGHPIAYHHIIINATLDLQSRFYIQPNIYMQAVNIEQYYTQMAAMYAHGYKMLVFVAHPGSAETLGTTTIGYRQLTVKFQAIFRKLLPEEIGQQWELRVAKSTLIKQMFIHWNGNLFLNAGSQSGCTSDSSHIFQTLSNITQSGGRLIGVEVTGMAVDELADEEDMTTAAMPMLQVAVDVFYEVPRTPSSERYVYQVVSCPMQSSFSISIGHGGWTSVIDWQGVLSQYLGTGWKLVEIFEDFSAVESSQMSGLSVKMSQSKNCLWIFEKPVSRLQDNTPFYAGTMVEHQFDSNVHMHNTWTFGGGDVHVNPNWEPVIDQFGRQGWQVVKILSTPDTRTEGMFQPTTYTRQMIFFQRLIEGMVDIPGASFPTVHPMHTSGSENTSTRLQ